MAITRSEMEEELHRTWRKHISETPVYKDLPRLAGRITVEGDFFKTPTPNKNKKSIELQSIRGFLTDLAKSLNQDLRSVEGYISALEKNWYFHIDPSISLITPEKWKEYGIPDRIAAELKKAADAVKKEESETEKVLQKQTSVLTNFRLSSSIDKEQTDFEKQDKLENVVVEQVQQEEKPKDVNRALLTEVKNVVCAVAARLETAEQQSKIKKYFDTVLQEEKFGDMELVIEDIFKNAIGENSKTAKVFKVIHQNIIFTAVFQLKSKLPMTAMTRDVRTREGWRIYIWFHNSVVVISHKRREQSLATAPADEQYWFQWDLTMTFDQEMTDMQSAILKITDLGFDDKINPKKREEINKALSSGNLIVT